RRRGRCGSPCGRRHAPQRPGSGAASPRRRLTGQSRQPSILSAVNALEGRLVVDLTRLLPGAFASRELLRLGARVVRIEPPDGDPLRHLQPAWHGELNGGKESVACDLKVDPALGRALCNAADVVLESFRPGV